jgi:hypothetical protein
MFIYEYVNTQCFNSSYWILKFIHRQCYYVLIFIFAYRASFAKCVEAAPNFCAHCSCHLQQWMCHNVSALTVVSIFKNVERNLLQNVWTTTNSGAAKPQKTKLHNRHGPRNSKSKICCLHILFYQYTTNLNCDVRTWQRKLLPSATAFVSEITNTQKMLWNFENFKFDSPLFVLNYELKCLT